MLNKYTTVNVRSCIIETIQSYRWENEIELKQPAAITYENIIE